MSIITHDYFCPEIGMASEFRTVLPDICLWDGKRPDSTLFLLSPEGDSGLSWITSTKLKALCDRYRTAAVLIPCLQGCYTNMAYGYPFYDSMKYVLQYIRTYIPGVLPDDGGIAVAGASAGGTAAVRWGLEEPEVIGACASFSGFRSPADSPEGWYTEKRLFSLYGDAQARKETEDELYSLFSKSGGNRCFIFSCCDDPGYPGSQKAAQLSGDSAVFRAKEGRADWKTWSDALGEFFEWWKEGEGNVAQQT